MIPSGGGEVNTSDWLRKGRLWGCNTINPIPPAPQSSKATWVLNMKMPVQPVLNTHFIGKVDAAVILWDVLGLNNGDAVRLKWKSVNSPWRQGVWMGSDLGIIVNSIQCKSIELWFDNSPKEIDIIVNTSNGFLHIYNIWDTGRGGGSGSQSYTSGMLVEVDDCGIRHYRCSDFGEEPDFSRIVFDIEVCSIK